MVRLKGGDPFVFGRGGEEAEAWRGPGSLGVVPGVSSAFGVPAAVGIPVTHRGLSSSVTVVTGRVDDPTGAGDWEALAKVDGTLVILMGMGAGRTSPPPCSVAAARLDPDGGHRAGHHAGPGGGPHHPRPAGRGRPGLPAVIVVGPVAALGAPHPVRRARSTVRPHRRRHPIGAAGTRPGRRPPRRRRRDDRRPAHRADRPADGGAALRAAPGSGPGISAGWSSRRSTR